MKWLTPNRLPNAIQFNRHEIFHEFRMELDEWSITDFCFLGIDIDTEDSLGAGLFGCYGNAEAYATETPNGNGG